MKYEQRFNYKLKFNIKYYKYFDNLNVHFIIYSIGNTFNEYLVIYIYIYIYIYIGIYIIFKCNISNNRYIYHIVYMCICIIIIVLHTCYINKLKHHRYVFLIIFNIYYTLYKIN